MKSPNFNLFNSSIKTFAIFQQSIIKHPEYSLTAKKNDIALILVAKRIWFTNFIRPACLQTDLTNADFNTAFTLTGWGIDGDECKLNFS